MLENPVAFVSGASGGIGEAIAERLAMEGYSLVLHFHKNAHNAKKISERLERDYNCRTLLFQADFADHANTIRKLEDLNIHPDVIVHNSGISTVGLMTDQPPTAVLQEFNIGLITPYLITQHFLSGMVQRKRGKIVVISSIWGLTGASCEVLYSTVKGALNTFVKALAKEVAPSNIQVNGIAPGAIQTAMLSQYDSNDIAEIVEEIPAGRLGTPAEVASAVAYLISKESNYVNGHILSINGAWYC